MWKKHLTKFNTHDKNYKMSIGGSYLNIIKTKCGKHTANITLKGEDVKVSPLRSRTKQVPTLAIQIPHSTGSPNQSNQVGKINKRHQNHEGRSKALSIFR